MQHVDMETLTVEYDKKKLKCTLNDNMQDLSDEFYDCNRERIKLVLLDNGR